MINQICLWSFSALSSGILFKRSHFALSMGGESTQNEMLGLPTSYHSTPEYKMRLKNKTEVLNESIVVV